MVINGEKSSNLLLQAGVPQGSVLGPLLFVLYINDITEEIHSNARLYADDTCIFSNHKDPDTAAYDQEQELDRISQWAQNWLVTFNPTKTVDLTFSRKRFIYAPHQ